MSEPRALIFDMDGVLVDSEPVHYTASLRMIAPHHISEEEYARFTGVAIRPYFEWMTAQFDLGLTLDEAVDQYTLFVTEEIERTPLEPLDGVRALLEAAREMGVAVALASQSVRVWVDATLRSGRLEGIFETLVCGDDVERGKPDPDIYLLAAERLGIAPSRCVAIEDSPAGVQSAVAAGMIVVQSRQASTAAPPQAGAHLVVESLREVDLSRLADLGSR